MLAKAEHAFHRPHGLTLCAWKISAMVCISRENWWRMVSILPSSCRCIPLPPSAASFEKLPSSWQAALALFSFLRSRRMPCSALLKRAGKQSCALKVLETALEPVYSDCKLWECHNTASAPRATDHYMIILVICNWHEGNHSSNCLENDL